MQLEYGKEFHNGVLHDLYSLLNIIRLLTSRGIELAGFVAHGREYSGRKTQRKEITW
jgi:hypothetical protein